MPSELGFDRLRLKNVRCFRDGEIALDQRVTVIVAGNASGKTTLLEALASLTQGDDEGLSDFPLRHGAGRGEIALSEKGGSAAVAKWDSKQPWHHRLPSDHSVFLYGRYRRVSDVPCRACLQTRTATDTNSGNRRPLQLPASRR